MPAETAILLVDDHPDTLFALESVLAPLGRPVLRAHSGEEALKCVLRGGVGLVLLDVVMPGTGGLEVAGYMRGVDRAQDIPVVLVTGLGRERALAERARALGAADLLTKPVDPWTLCTKAEYLLERYERVVALREQVRELRAELELAAAAREG
ncbi:MULTISPECIES: response regulator [unclassified Streptomyces]|uniref:Response regulator n=1 Tax=Streptomyces evansiae TaxID=3075535 RepID=A0ABU2QZK6_9ACTN|nr:MULTISPECIES: response regulator [unclassified Streptomyces]MDT0408614.1 response regulator [Streptomyces sp. DSM 41979]MYQ57192.1 response regulator [Streptomyces sp. SID4926]MYR29332.1 response regulator [Streptomyces sp. SID4945]SCD84169.1 Response regulator receiver domain-containing protein [Streptomyces sp. TverLS-915]SCE53322.1 Response regulator receiver domain-containing protein [Streptomyces sp. DfronAA-171]